MGALPVGSALILPDMKQAKLRMEVIIVTIVEIIQKKLCNGDPINAVQYVRLEQFSEKRRDQIAADGTEACRKFLDENPNIILKEKPYIDYDFSTLDFQARKNLMKMQSRLVEGDVELMLVDDMQELLSSYADAIMLGYLFDNFDGVVLDLKHMEFHVLTEDMDFCTAF